MLIVEDLTVTVKRRTAIKVLFIYFNFFPQCIVGYSFIFTCINIFLTKHTIAVVAISWCLDLQHNLCLKYQEFGFLPR